MERGREAYRERVIRDDPLCVLFSLNSQLPGSSLFLRLAPLAQLRRVAFTVAMYRLSRIDGQYRRDRMDVSDRPGHGSRASE